MDMILAARRFFGGSTLQGLSFNSLFDQELVVAAKLPGAAA
jgi:hypothetical protein